MARDDHEGSHPGARTGSSPSGSGGAGAGAGSSVNGGFNGSNRGSGYGGAGAGASGGFGGGNYGGGYGGAGAGASGGFGGHSSGGYGGAGAGSSGNFSGHSPGAGFGSPVGAGGSFGSLSGGNPYGGYTGPSRYGPPGQSALGYRSLVNAVNAIGGTPAERVRSVLSNMGYTNPIGLAGMLGTFDVESGFNPKAIGDKKLKNRAYGLAQWRESRVTDLNNYAKKMGLDPHDLATQAAFAGVEMKTNPEYTRAYKGVTNATSVRDAVAAMNAYEKPRGYKPGGNPSKVEGWAERLSRANKFANISGNISPLSGPSGTVTAGFGIGPGASAQGAGSAVYGDASAGAGIGPGASEMASLNPQVNPTAGYGVGPGASVFGAGSPVYSSAGAMPSIGPGASATAYSDVPQGSWGDNLGAGLERVKAYASDYIERAKSPENIAAFAKQNPMAALGLANAFGSLSPGKFGPGGDGSRQMASNGGWFDGPSKKKSETKSDSDSKDKKKKPGNKPRQHPPTKWVFPTMLTRPYTRII